MRYSRTQLIDAMDRGARPEFVFVWRAEPDAGGVPGPGCLSQWWPAPMLLDGTRYPTAEHFMMQNLLGFILMEVRDAL